MTAPDGIPDPTYGYDLDALRRVPAPPGPDDFDAFWRETYAEARAVPLRLERRPVPSPDARFRIWEVEFDAWDGARIGGWLAAPADGGIEKGIVAGHGYGGRDAPALVARAATLSPCARGFGRSARPDLPGEAMRHVLHGIGRRETYLHRGCAADLWAAATALLELHPAVAPRLGYRGGSFGGGIGALALPWDARFRHACLDIPSFGNHPLRVTLPCLGSGEAVRRHYREHPGVLDVLAYFDAATAARRLRIPILVAAALADAAVPPPGQFAVYNGACDAIRGAAPGTPEPRLFVRRIAHSGTPAETRESVALERLLDEIDY